ncbi:hypothetical protein GCWU000325_02475 [Alloprevotella tannerae ATCC 51259]|uniref:Uncharacterized protein n=1 Tax=Alloprevotella tannerae ATCC 51259 TaxID=626522 RepID=C9LJR1_9BACT|nr:hypothetical protein GCWU000325_02475 [Alloprevotella tannerae ATCC 51259]
MFLSYKRLFSIIGESLLNILSLISRTVGGVLKAYENSRAFIG